MKKRWKIAFFLIILCFDLFGCAKKDVVEKEDKSEEVKAQEMKQVEDERVVLEPEMQKEVEENNVNQEEVISPVYRGNTILTEDNIVEVLKTILSIADEKELIKLESLPLTENFFKECVEDFPYVEEIKEYKEINIEFWSIDGEGKCICLVDFCKEENPENNPILCKPDCVYFIEMKVIDDKIDGMKMEIIR